MFFQWKKKYKYKYLFIFLTKLTGFTKNYDFVTNKNVFYRSSGVHFMHKKKKKLNLLIYIYEVNLKKSIS